MELHTGSIYVQNQTLLDREVRSLYSATLQARDTDGKVGTTVLEITVTDINDQPPVFNRQSYQEYVEEGEQVKIPIEVIFLSSVLNFERFLISLIANKYWMLVINTRYIQNK